MIRNGTRSSLHVINKMNLPLIDCGVNFGSKHYSLDKLNRLLQNAGSKQVTHVLSISNSIPEVRQNILNYQHLQASPVKYLYTAGVHPHNAKNFERESSVEFLEECLQSPQCVAVGECGLDYNRMFSPKEDQIKAFEAQIEIAKRCNKQLYLHCRDAFDDFIHILRLHNYFNGLVHCFTGNLEQALAFTSLGFQIGITGWLLDKRRNHDLVEAIQDPRITLEMIVVETDAPFLSIQKNRKSVPEDTLHIIERISELKKIPFEECSQVIYQNSLRLLGLY
jgi:TatD DNase family protein